MKNIVILLLTFSISSFFVYGQGMTDRLKNKLTNSVISEPVNINIYLKDVVNPEQLKLKSTKIVSKEKRREVVSSDLEIFSKTSQSDLIHYLNANGATGINQHWLVNMVNCTIDKTMIEVLSKMEMIESIDYNEKFQAIYPEEDLPFNAPNINTSEPDTAWNVKKVEVSKLWKQGYQGQNVVVALLDTGVNYNHDDIEDNLWSSKEYPYGWNFVDNNNNPKDKNGHGSHCAGTIAGTGKSGVVTGMAISAQVMALQVSDAKGWIDWNMVITALEFAVKNGADLCSMSFGFDANDVVIKTKMRETMVNLLNLGVLAFLSSGNDGAYINTTPGKPLPNNVGNPGNCPPPWMNPEQPNPSATSAVITIGATNINDIKADFSSEGPSTWEDAPQYNDYIYDQGNQSGLIKPDVVFPGEDITSLNGFTDNDYTVKSGTSMATPGAAAIAALMLSKNGNLTPEDICRIMETTATKIDGKNEKNNKTGSGRINPIAALNAVESNGPKSFNLVTFDNNNATLTWQEPENKTGLIGYNVYRNREKVNKEILTVLTFEDIAVKPGKYIYYSTAIYDGFETPSPVYHTEFSTSCLPPVNIETEQIEDNILISWNVDPQAVSEVVGYNIYLEGRQINDEIITGNNFVDSAEKKDKSEYSYSLDVLYKDNCYSIISNPVVIKYVKYDNYCLAPVDLNVITNTSNEVTLSWETPAVNMNFEQGTADGSYGKNIEEFYVAYKWTTTQLKNYYGLRITEVSVFPTEEAEFTLMIWEPGILKYEQNVTDLKYGEFNRIKLDIPYTIDYNKDLRVGFKVICNKNSSPLSYAKTNSAAETSSLISFNGTKWDFLSKEGIKGSWLIGMRLQDMIYSSADGFNVYKNNNKINSKPIEEKIFTDTYEDKSEYYVTAIYNNICESKASNIATPISDGINDLEINDNLKFYPNPVKNILHIDGQNKSIFIYDNTGKLIKSIPVPTDSENITINVSELSDGIYFIRVITKDNKIMHGKFFKMY